MFISRLLVLLFVTLSVFLTTTAPALARIDNLIIDPQQPVELDRACVTGGCSGELCVDPSTGPINSTCVWQAEYACLKFARCERQGSGQCGWTHTNEYQACLTGAEPTTNPQPQPPAPTDEPTKPTPPTYPPRPITLYPIPSTIPNAKPCTPRPPCLDSHPICVLAEPETGWCPPAIPSNPPPVVIDPSAPPQNNPQITPTLKPTWAPPFWPTWKPLPRPLISDLPHASQTAITRLKEIFSHFRLNFILWQN